MQPARVHLPTQRLLEADEAIQRLKAEHAESQERKAQLQAEHARLQAENAQLQENAAQLRASMQIAQVDAVRAWPLAQNHPL